HCNYKPGCAQPCKSYDTCRLQRIPPEKYGSEKTAACYLRSIRRQAVYRAIAAERNDGQYVAIQKKFRRTCQTSKPVQAFYAGDGSAAIDNPGIQQQGNCR